MATEQLKQAFNIVKEASERVHGTLEDHKVIQSALKVLADYITSLEKPSDDAETKEG